MQNLNYIHHDQRLLNDIIYAGRCLLMPRILKPLSKLITEIRYVSRAESARPGMWDNSIAPPAMGVMDAFTNPLIERITMVGPSQYVKTEIIKNIICCIVYYGLGPVGIMYPTDGAARDFSVEKLEPMIKYNDWLREKIAPAKSNSKDNKTLFKKFGPYFIAIMGSLVPQDLARRSLKFVVIDDRDRVGVAGREGDSAELLWQRTESYAFFGRKRIEISSPTIEGYSPIVDAYKDSDMGEWFVPCPHCNHYQTLKFDNLIWDKTEDKDLFGNVTGKIHHPETVKLKCENCNELIDEKNKSRMINSGKRICKHPERSDHFGLHINRLYSLMSSWVDLVKEFLRCKNDRTKLQVFINTALAKTWKLEEGETIDEHSLLARVEDYLTEDNPYLPNGILYLAVGTDTQGDRLETAVWGVGRDEELWLVHYEQLIGDPDFGEVFNLHDKLLDKKWEREDGTVLQIGSYRSKRRYYGAFIDSQGKKTNTKAVYEYTLNRQHKGILSIKGRPNDIRTSYPPVINASKVGPYRQTILYNLGVDTIKLIMWNRLKNNPVDDKGKFKGGPKTIHFTSKFCDYEWFKMLLSEMPITSRNNRGEQVINWKKITERNEPWDTLIYAYAAYLNSYVNINRLEENLKKQLLDKTEKEQSVTPGQKKLNMRRVPIRSSFIDGWKS